MKPPLFFFAVPLLLIATGAGAQKNTAKRPPLSLWEMDSVALVKGGDTASTGFKHMVLGPGSQASGHLDHWKREGWWTFFQDDTVKLNQKEYDDGIPIEQRDFDYQGDLLADFLIPDHNAIFPGGPHAWSDYYSEQITDYLVLLQAGSVGGTVEIGFMVEKDGSIDRVSLLKGTGDIFDDFCFGIVAQSPRWNPAKINHVPMPQYFRTRFHFDNPED